MIAPLVALLVAVAQPDPLASVRDPALRAMVASEVQRAAARGLPTAPLVAKALEGQLKGAPPERIRAALTTVSTRLDTARSRLGAATEADLIAAADALAAGVPPDALLALRTAMPTGPIALPLGVLTELVSRGVDPKVATRQLIALISRKATPQQLLALGAAFSNDVRRGQAATAALDERVKGLMLMLGPAGSVGSTALPARP